MIKKFFPAALALSIAAGLSWQPARAEPNGVKAGFLTCEEGSGWGFVFGSTRDLKCTYTDDKGTSERYIGHINKFGVDIGYVHGAVVAWAVFAPTVDGARGALAGTYIGATGGASFGAGGSANVLVGGSDKSISLQPLSLEGTEGVNVAAGLAQIVLKRPAG
jgi:Protein of unknown function (DUF992)